MELISALFIVLPVPRESFGCAMPLSSSFDCGGWYSASMAFLMIPNMRPSFLKLQIVGLIVGAIFISVMNVESAWHVTAIGNGPDENVKTLAIALEILPAKVVAASLKVLNGSRNNLDLHCDA